MVDSEKEFYRSRYHICFISIFIFILIIYSNTFTAEWHLDDYANITQNSHVHLNNLHLKTLHNTFYFGTKKKISRPLARLTFGLNWYFGKDGVIGYHIVNIVIHQLTAFVLFLFVLNLLNTPNLKDKYRGNEYFIAFLSAVLWAINPIQTQAVTYIVQRMASMAALFYVLSMYWYLKGRISDTLAKRMIFYILACISFISGLATKENTVTLPIAIILMEIIFFQDVNKPEIRRKLYGSAIIVCVCIVIVSSQLFLHGKILSIFKGSNFRYFTPFQRLMTEARVIVFYLIEIFYPVPTRLSIEHDIQISTTLFNPWTTLPAILLVILLICFGVLNIKKRPLVSFAILFFLLNHFIESTVLGLELIFEHRNYVPSFFLFLPVSAGIKWLLDHYWIRNRILYYILVVFIIFILMSLGIGTYVRNMAWKTELSILEDAVQKAPNTARPLSNLARIYYTKIGKPVIALNMFQKALTLNKNNRYQDSMILSNIGSIYYVNGHIMDAIRYYTRALKNYPGYTTTRYKLAIALAMDGKYEESRKQLNNVILNVPDNVTDPLNLKGLILTKEKKFKQAFQAFRKCLGIHNNDKNALLNVGALYYLTGDYQRSEMFFKIAYTHHKNELFALLWLIEVNLKTNDRHDIHKYVDKLFLNASAEVILSLPKALSDKKDIETGIIAPASSSMLIKEIARKMKPNTGRIN